MFRVSTVQQCCCMLYNMQILFSQACHVVGGTVVRGVLCLCQFFFSCVGVYVPWMQRVGLPAHTERRCGLVFLEDGQQRASRFFFFLGSLLVVGVLTFNPRLNKYPVLLDTPAFLGKEKQAAPSVRVPIPHVFGQRRIPPPPVLYPAPLLTDTHTHTPFDTLCYSLWLSSVLLYFSLSVYLSVSLCEFKIQPDRPEALGLPREQQASPGRLLRLGGHRRQLHPVPRAVPRPRLQGCRRDVSGRGLGCRRWLRALGERRGGAAGQRAWAGCAERLVRLLERRPRGARRAHGCHVAGAQ